MEDDSIIYLFLVIITSKQFACKTVDKRNNFQPRSSRGNRSPPASPPKWWWGRGEGGDGKFFKTWHFNIQAYLRPETVKHVFLFSLFSFSKQGNKTEVFVLYRGATFFLVCRFKRGQALHCETFWRIDPRCRNKGVRAKGLKVSTLFESYSDLTSDQSAQAFHVKCCLQKAYQSLFQRVFNR